MKLLNNYLKNNVFMFSGGTTKQIAANTNSMGRDINKSLLPIVIIAREHYQEFDKVYPVPDKSDVKNIIENEFQNLKMVSIESKDLTSSNAKIFAFDDTAEAFLNEQFCIYVPETLLSQFLKDSELTTVERLGQTVNLIRKGDTVYSAAGIGLYQDPNMFLFSSGAGEAESRASLNQEDYFQQLLNHIAQLKFPDLPMILGGQVAHRKLIASLHFPSIAAGAVLSIGLYWLMLWGNLQLAQAHTGDETSAAEVKQVIQSKQKLEEQLTLVHQLNGARNNNVSGDMIWKLVAELLENGVSVGSLLYEEEELKLNLLAPSSAEAVKLLRSMKQVETVTVDGDIFDMQGKQNVTVLVAFNKEGADV